MALKACQIPSLATYLCCYKGQRVGKIIQYSKDVYSFRFQRGGRLTIDLDNQSPAVFVSEKEESGPSLSSTGSAILRKRLSGAEFEKAEALNEDRLLALRFIAINDIFQEERVSLIVELIPTKANLLFLDEGGKILFAHRPKGLTDPRPLFPGIVYEPPEKKGAYSSDSEALDIEGYFRECERRGEEIVQRRKSALYADFFRELRAKIKSLKRKITQIDRDIEEGKKHLADADYGNYIFTFPDSISLGDSSMDYYGLAVPIDPLKNPSENASAFFKRAKKAKTAISLGQENRQNALKELSETERLLEFAICCDEEALRQLAQEHLPERQKGKAKSQKMERHALPFIAKIDGRPIYFGKSAKQNDALTFLYATKPNYLWFHPKDRVGAHVILPMENPDNAFIQYACELALVASGLEDGEVQYAPHKNIRKGSVPGQVILSNYQSTFIRSVSEKVKRAFSLAVGSEGKA